MAEPDSVPDKYSQRPVTSAEFQAHTLEDKNFFAEYRENQRRFEEKFDAFAVRVEPYLETAQATKLGLRGFGWLVAVLAALGTAIVYFSSVFHGTPTP